MERRLAAILAADVVGYSRLMGADERATLAALKAHRDELVDAKISEHRGRIVKLTGDGMLVEFPSVVNAVACAADVQRKMRERNVDVPEARRIEFRVGVNLGDVIVEGDDILGDGVNVAARLEGIAPPGGIAISATVRDHVGNRLDLAFEDMGEQALKNIDRPVRVYSVALAAPSAVAASSAHGMADVQRHILNAAALVLTGALAAGPTFAQDSTIYSNMDRVHPVHARARHGGERAGLATRIGVEILKGGGNAVDAAVAAGFALAVTLPRRATWVAADSRSCRMARSGEGRDRLPRGRAGAATRDMFLDASGNADSKQSRGADIAPGVPGTVAGLGACAQEIGHHEPRAGLAPAIALADKGRRGERDLRGGRLPQERSAGQDMTTAAIFMATAGAPAGQAISWVQNRPGAVARADRPGRGPMPSTKARSRQDRRQDGAARARCRCRTCAITRWSSASLAAPTEATRSSPCRRPPPAARTWCRSSTCWSPSRSAAGAGSA